MDDTPIAIDGPDADARGKKEAAKEADPMISARSRRR